MPADRSGDGVRQNVRVTSPTPPILASGAAFEDPYQPASGPPPLPWLLAYRVLGLRLPQQYRAWVAEDVASKSFLTWRIGRTLLWALGALGLFYVTQVAIHEPPQRKTLIQGVLFAIAFALLSSGKTLVRRTLRWQRIDKHGRPVKPKKLAVLSNFEAGILGLVVVVALTAGLGVLAFALHPTSIAGTKCQPTDPETLSLLRAGLKRKDTKIENPQSLKFGDSQILAAILRNPGEDRGLLAAWERKGATLYEYRRAEDADTSRTTFAPPPALDRSASEAIMKLAVCVVGPVEKKD